MEKEKVYKILIIFQFVLNLLAITLITLIAMGIVDIREEETTGCKGTKCKELITTENADDISITILSMNKPILSTETPNHVMTVTGEMKLSFNEKKYSVVNIIGSCTGKDGEKYSIFGPSEGAISLHNGETEYQMVESIGNDEDAIYPDGTIKKHKDIDWTKVEIKSCEIESLKAFSYTGNNEILVTKKINYKKEFNN